MTEWRSAICEIKKIKIHYSRTGVSKPPLVLLHGLMTDGSCWAPIARALEGEYDVIMPDARGHGKSSAPNDGYRYEDHANDTIGLIKALGLSSPIVLGHSMGGMTAVLVAHQMQKLLAGLILVDPPFLSPAVQREVYESDVAEQHRKLLAKSSETLLVEAQNKHPHRSLEILKLLAEARCRTSMSAFQVLTPPYPEYSQLVSTIDIPTLLVIGESGVVSMAVAEELACLQPSLRIKNFTGVGHGLHYDRPEQFVTALKSFLCTI